MNPRSQSIYLIKNIVLDNREKLLFIISKINRFTFCTVISITLLYYAVMHKDTLMTFNTYFALSELLRKMFVVDSIYVNDNITYVGENCLKWEQLVKWGL